MSPSRALLFWDVSLWSVTSNCLISKLQMFFRSMWIKMGKSWQVKLLTGIIERYSLMIFMSLSGHVYNNRCVQELFSSLNPFLFSLRLWHIIDLFSLSKSHFSYIFNIGYTHNFALPNFSIFPRVKIIISCITWFVLVSCFWNSD